MALDPNRAFCKKGCGGDGTFDECKSIVCIKLCVKEEIGNDDNKWGGIS